MKNEKLIRKIEAWMNDFLDATRGIKGIFDDDLTFEESAYSLLKEAHKALAK
jgi:hypothetical protein